MKQRFWNAAPVFCIVAIAASCCLATWTFEEEPPEGRRKVKAIDIGRSIDLVGRLGVPLATVVEIDGRWENGDMSKPSAMVFVVTSVNGIQLDEKVKFNEIAVRATGDDSWNVKPKVGEIWHCRSAIELAQFRNVMEKNWELFYDGPVAPPAWGDGPFASELIISSRDSRIEVSR